MRMSSIPLTAGEISHLWTTYINQTMIRCGLKYFISHVEDEEMKAVFQETLKLSENHVEMVKKIMIAENFAVPLGFTDNDVNPSAPRLYSDKLMLLYLLNMGTFLIQAYGLAVSTSVRQDILSFYSNELSSAKEIYEQCKLLAMKKGLIVRPATPAVPEKVSFVQSRDFFNGFIKKRPLLAIEITNLDYNVRRNMLGAALIIGFSQVARSKRVRDYMIQGRDIAIRHANKFSRILNEEFIPSAPRLDDEVSASTVPPFSDKLMMFHISALVASGVAQYGISLSTAMRRDLQMCYARSMSEIGRYAKEGANLLIDQGWMERPPQAVDRRALNKKKEQS